MIRRRVSLVGNLISLVFTGRWPSLAFSLWGGASIARQPQGLAREFNFTPVARR